MRRIRLPVLARTLALALLAPAATALTDDDSWATDRLVLDNGECFEGIVLSEDEQRYVLRVPFGGTIDILKRRVVEREPLQDENRPAIPVNPRSETYTLHDRFGTRTGWRRLVERPSQFYRRACRLREEVVTLEPRGEDVIRLTLIEYLSPDDRLLGFFYRESVGYYEKTIEGEREPGDRMRLEEHCRAERTTRYRPWPEDLVLPLSARRKLFSEGSGSAYVFDPMRGRDQTWTLAKTGIRTVRWDGHPTSVDIATLRRGDTDSEIWFGGDGVLLEELNGDAFFAARWTPPEEDSGNLHHERSLELGYRNGEHRVAVFAPNPAWKIGFRPRRSDELMTMLEQETRAEIKLIVIDGKSGGSLPDVAADAVLREAGVGSELLRSFAAEIGGRNVGAGVARILDGEVPLEIRVVVWEWDSQHIALAFEARLADLQILGPDFAEVLGELTLGK